MTSSRRVVPPFRYMAWAKARSLAPVHHHLGLSGLAPPAESDLPLAELGRDLAQSGRHMPPVFAARMATRLHVAPEHLALTLGTSHAVYLVCASRLSPGDAVWVEEPAYEMLHAVPALFGATVSRITRTFDDGWRLPSDLADRVLDERPSMVVISNPHNPTGIFMSRDALTPLARACATVGATLLVDEVYLEFAAAPHEHTAFGTSDAVVTASSFTKAYGLGTVRLGWLLGAEDVVADALTYNDYISVLYPNPSAWVGMAVLDALPVLHERAKRTTEAGLEVVRRWVASRDDVRWHEPDLGIVGFVELPVADAQTFVDHLIAEHDTLVVPGNFFGAPRFARLGFGASVDVLEEGLRRLGRALESWGSPEAGPGETGG